MRCGRFERVLFTTDFSAVSEQAASFAHTMACQNRARLYVLHVIDTSGEPAGFYVPHVSFDKLDKEMVPAAQDMLKAFSARVLKGAKGIELRVLIGEPYKEIVKFINGQAIDVVVMGTGRRSGIDRFLFGSTTERVLRKADCPVLIIPPSAPAPKKR
jgi:nucleotide-binding universal stress UspA family protein